MVSLIFRGKLSTKSEGFCAIHYTLRCDLPAGKSHP